MKRQLTASFFLLFLIVTGFRILNLEADPPSDFSWSGGYFADEGFWSHNARNVVLFGKPVQDDWDARIVSPIFARLQAVVFRIFGSGIVPVRIIAILSSLILAGAAFSLFRTQFDPQSSFLFAILASLNYPMLVLGRQGILDPFAAALCVVALLLLMANSNVAAFIAGIFVVAMCTTKYLMVYALIPCGYLVWSSKKYPGFLIGIASAGALWFFGNYLPNRELLGAYSAYYASQQSWKILEILKNISLQPFYLYFVKTPAILCLANLGIWLFLAHFVKPRSGEGSPFSRLERMCFLWLIAGILFFALWRYRPFRYYTSLIPPMVAVAVFVLLLFKENRLSSLTFRWIPFVGVFLPFVQIAFVLLDRHAGWGFVPAELGIHALDAFLFLALSILVLWGLRSAGSRSRYVVWGFVAVLFLSDARNYLAWMLRPEYAAVQIGGDLERRAPNGVISGQWAPELCLNNRLRVIPVWRGFVNSEAPFERYGITHILQWKYSLGGEKFEEWYPEDFRSFQFVTKYRIKNSDLFLYERKVPRAGQEE